VTFNNAIGGEIGKAKGIGAGSTREYNNIGVITDTVAVSFAGFGIQGGISDNGNSRLAKRLPTDTFYQTKSEIGGFIGATYYTGPWGGGFYYDTATSKGDPTLPGTDTYHNLSVGGQYTVAPGWEFFTNLAFESIRNQLNGIPIATTVAGSSLVARQANGALGTTVSPTYSHIGNNYPVVFTLGTQFIW